MLFSFGNVLVFLLVGIGFVFMSLLIGHLVRPKVPTQEKLATYECGELPTGGAWVNFNIRFYIIALLFIIFDVEIAFMFPVGVVFRQWIKDGAGVLALAEIAVFVLILMLGLVYAWVKGDLEWVKKVSLEERVAGSEVVPKASKI
jgi:NADH-quinone oxidoreductase subunit A